MEGFQNCVNPMVAALEVRFGRCDGRGGDESEPCHCHITVKEMEPSNGVLLLCRLLCSQLEMRGVRVVWNLDKLL